MNPPIPQVRFEGTPPLTIRERGILMVMIGAYTQALAAPYLARGEDLSVAEWRTFLEHALSVIRVALPDVTFVVVDDDGGPKN